MSNPWGPFGKPIDPQTIVAISAEGKRLREENARLRALLVTQQPHSDTITLARLREAIQGFMTLAALDADGEAPPRDLVAEIAMRAVEEWEAENE